MVTQLEIQMLLSALGIPPSGSVELAQVQMERLVLMLSKLLNERIQEECVTLCLQMERRYAKEAQDLAERGEDSQVIGLLLKGEACRECGIAILEKHTL